MATLLAEGIYPCTVLTGSFGEDDKGSPQVQINVRIDDGPSAGRTCTYSDQVNNKSALYVSRSCRAAGWKGHDLKTLKTDIKEWVEKTGGKTTVEVRYVEVKKGKKYDAWVDAGCPEGEKPLWDKVNSLGRGAKPLAEPTAERLADANDAMRAAMEADGVVPRGDEGDDDSIPF